MAKFYSILFLLVMFSKSLYASSDEEDIPIFTECLHSSPKMSSNRVIHPNNNASEEEDDIPILSERLHSSLKMSSSTAALLEGNAREKGDDISTQQGHRHTSQPHISQILQARHPEGKTQVDEINPRRGEGLPYRYTKNLDELVKEYQERKWEGHRLDLSNGSYGGEDIGKLLVFRDLLYLDLSGNPLSSEDIFKLAMLPDLRELRLNTLTTKRKLSFAVISGFTKLKIVHLCHNQIGDEDVQALVANANLRELHLADNKIGIEGTKSLAATPSLTLLDLGGNQVRDEGSQFLANNTSLDSLNLWGNQISNKGAKALATNTILTFLILDGNLIGEEGAEALAKNTILTSLALGSNRIGSEGAKALAKNTTLTSLNLKDNQIGKEGAQALANNATLTTLHLDASLSNGILYNFLIEMPEMKQFNFDRYPNITKGAKKIASAFFNYDTVLDLSGNQITNEGAAALTKNTTLVLLDLRWNEITDEILAWPEAWWTLFNQYGGGVMYRYRSGVPENDAKAIEWLTYAANHGDNKAIAYLKEMGRLPALETYVYPTLITQGYEEVYQKFLRGKLIYKPNPNSDKGRVDLPVRELANPLDGVFNLSRCGDAERHLSISTGYRKGRNPANKDKVEVWIAPKFLIEKELSTTAAHFKPIVGNWKADAHVGLFWTWGGWDNMNWYDYLTNQYMKDSVNNNLYNKWYRSGKSMIVGPAELGRLFFSMSENPMPYVVSCFIFDIN